MAKRVKLSMGQEVPRTSEEFQRIYKSGGRKEVEREITDGVEMKIRQQTGELSRSELVKAAILKALRSAGFKPVSEYRFSKVRAFRFDIALPDERIAVEYEGIFSDTSRHTTVGGYSRDCEKYNLAVVERWRVLRYTANMISGKNGEYRVVQDVRDMLRNEGMIARKG